MNQGKLERLKQEMARVNVDILGMSELKSTAMSEFNSDNHYIYYCRQESLRRNGVAIMVKKRVRNAVLGCNLKNYRIISTGIFFWWWRGAVCEYLILPSKLTEKDIFLGC